MYIFRDFMHHDIYEQDNMKMLASTYTITAVSTSQNTTCSVKTVNHCLEKAVSAACRQVNELSS